MRTLLTIALTSLLLAGCASRSVQTSPSMSAGSAITDLCGPYKFTDPSCNAHLSAAGGGSN